jgi:ABC-type transport system substrate-binding protein
MLSLVGSRQEQTMAKTRIATFIAALSLAGGTVQANPSSATSAGRPTYSGSLTIASNLFLSTGFVGGVSAFSHPEIYPSAFLGAEPLIDSPIMLDAHGNYAPDMALVVPTVANGGIRVVHGEEVVTIRLKRALRWSDGSPITPADYVSSYLLDTSPAISLYNGACDLSKWSAAASADTLTLTYKGIYATPLDGCVLSPVPIEYLQHKYKIALPSSLRARLDSDRVAALFRSPGFKGSAVDRLTNAWLQDPYDSAADLWSGPYKLAQSIPGQLVVLRPNPYYTALPPDPRHPRPAELRFVVRNLEDPDFQRGLASDGAANTYDLLALFAADDLPILRRSPYKVVVADYIQIEHLELNQANPALSDLRVRLALSYGLDRMGYIKSVYPTLSDAERHEVLDPSPVPKVSPWSIGNELPANPYDPAKARALLASAGYGSGRRLHLSFYTLDLPAFRVRSAQALKRQWARIGVDLAIHLTTPSRMFADYAADGIVQRRRFDIAEFSYGGAIEPDSLVANIDPGQIPDQSQPNGQNYSGIRDVQLLQLFLQANQTPDPEARRRLYAQVQRRMVDNVYWIPLFDLARVILVKPTLGNFVNQPSWYAWNAFQWYRRG